MAVEQAPFITFAVDGATVIPAASKTDINASLEAIKTAITHDSGQNFPWLQQMPPFVSESLKAEITALQDLVTAAPTV